MRHLRLHHLDFSLRRGAWPAADPSLGGPPCIGDNKRGRNPGGFLKIRTEFDRCWPWLEASLERYGRTHTKEDVWRRIESGKAYFWPDNNSAIVAEILNHPTGLRTFHGWLAGGELSEIVARIPSLEQFAIERGCHRATVTGRPGWQRVFPDGYRVLGVRLVKVLKSHV